MLYQLFTEDINRPSVTRILDSHFPGYTLIPSAGHWQGVSEPSLVAEIETNDGVSVYRAAEEIRAANNQQAVLVEAIPSESELVCAQLSPSPSLAQHEPAPALV